MLDRAAPRVAFLCHPYHRGGVTRWMVDAAEAWAAGGRECWFVVPRPSSPFLSGKGRPTMAALLSEVRHRPSIVSPAVGAAFEFGTSAYRSAVYARALQRVPAGTPVIVSDDPCVWSAAALLSRTHPVIGVLHADDQPYIDLARRHRAALSALVCVSGRIERRVRRELGDSIASITTIPCGVPLGEQPETFARASHPARLVWIGRMEETQKRVSDLVPIASALRARGLDFRFDVLGDGAARADVERAIDDAALRGRFQLHGWIDAAATRAVLREADVMLIPSNFEGMSIAVIEALAEGCAVVSSRVSGVEDLEHRDLARECLRLFDIGDVQAAADAVRAVLALPAESRRRAARALATAEFSIEECCDRYERIVRALQRSEVERTFAPLMPRKARVLAAAFASYPIAVLRGLRQTLREAGSRAHARRASVARLIVRDS